MNGKRYQEEFKVGAAKLVGFTFCALSYLKAT